MRSAYLFMILLLALVSIAACGPSNNTDTDDTDDYAEYVEDFVPYNGMYLTQLADVPGVEWRFDTIYGLCEPDTMVLWMSYNGIDYLTNVMGIDGDYPMLSKLGLKRIENGFDDTEFAKTDFAARAALTTDGSISRDAFRVICDTAFLSNSKAMCQVVEDFFTSYGNIQYMSRKLAANWSIINAQSEIDGDDYTNPFNGTNYIEFDPKSIVVKVASASEGMVEVAAYCVDPYTLGQPGWGYWTVFMCRENGHFKVREMPARHRKFSSG